MLIYCRLLSKQPVVKQAVSNVKWKLKQYAESGNVHKFSLNELKRSETRFKKKSMKSFYQNGVSPQKALILLKSRYDGVIIPDELGNAIDLHSLSPLNLRVNDPRLLQLFNGLIQMKKIQKRRIDDRIIMSLTGVNEHLLADSYFVARDVRHLLKQDGDVARAMEVCRLARLNGTVGLNAILEWCLQRSKKDLARKVYVNRGRWGIPLSPATLVTYFSGLSDCHEWGHVSDSDAQDVIQKFSESKMRNAETFNAALKFLMKNYSNEQFYGWDFFGKLEEFKILPDAQTFTIFLQGLRAFYKNNVEEIQRDASILAEEKTRRLFEKQAILVLRANMVMEKAMELARPPTPPSEDQVNENPLLLVNYKRKIMTPLLDIDRHLAVAFVLCYSHNDAGTSWTRKNGSHYWYIQQVLTFFQAWMPEVNDIFRFISNSVSNSQTKLKAASRNPEEELFFVEPSEDIRIKTDRRVANSQVPEEYLPQNVVKMKTLEELNPWLPFPPPPFVHSQDKRLFTGVERQLIDFARVKSSDLLKEYFENQARRDRRSSQHYETKKKRSSRKREQQGINKFILRILLDCFLRIGLYDEFYKVMWLSILVWADIKIDLSRLRNITATKMLVTGEKMYPEIDSLAPKSSYSGFCELKAQLDVIDIGIIEDFIHKIEEHMPSKTNPTARAVELVAIFCNRDINKERELSPRPSTFNAIFSILNRDIYRYNDRNQSLRARVNQQNNPTEQTLKLLITIPQLHDLLDSLDILVRSIFARYGGPSMRTEFLHSYNNLIQRIYLSTWDRTPDFYDNDVEIHKKIIRSGILMYKPNHLIDKRQDHNYSRMILKSLNFVHAELKSRNDLSKENIDLMMCLRNLFNFEREKDESEQKFEALQFSIYRLVGKVATRVRGG